MVKQLQVSIFAGLLLVSAAGWGQTALRAWNIHPDGYPVTEAMKSFVDEVGRSTKGKYKIELFSNGSLGDQPKAVQMLKSGEVDVAEFSSAPLSDVVPGLKAFNLPFLFTDSAHMFRYLDGQLGARLAVKLADAGFVVLGWYDGGARSFYCANKPINTGADLVGQKIRVQQSDVYIGMVTQLGATPMPLPYKDVLDALQQKKIDCAENNMPSYESTGHYKVAKYVYLTNHVVSPEALVVSTKLWTQLSADDKALFQKAGQNSALLMRELWTKRVASARATVTKEGAQVVTVTDFAPFVRKMAPLYAKYLADPTVRAELFTIIGNQ
ncbi:TRAP transporter substrate-binding protein [Rhodoferax sp.]|uniref:TRAP transporter substrate-binding protein n=1 Tax=Rhodoferax sp. TaxID=50421 RepID=UPI00374CB845